MEPKPELILNASAIIFGFTIAFFHNWAYSSDEPYENKHLFFLIPLFLAEIILGTTLVMALIPAVVDFVIKSGPFLIGLALSLLIVAKILSIAVEWKKKT